MRDIAKTLTFATLHFGVGFTITYLLTGSLSIATGVALLEPTVNTVVFYAHEKVWNRVSPQATTLWDGHGHQRMTDAPFAPTPLSPAQAAKTAA